MDPVRYIAKVLPDGHLPLPDTVKGAEGKIFEVILLPLSPGIEVYNRMEEIVGARKIAHYSLDELASFVAGLRGVEK